MRIFFRFLMGMAFVCMSSAWSQEQARVISSTPTLVPSTTVNGNGEVVMYTAFNVVYQYAGKEQNWRTPVFAPLFDAFCQFLRLADKCVYSVDKLTSTVRFLQR